MALLLTLLGCKKEHNPFGVLSIKTVSLCPGMQYTLEAYDIWNGYTIRLDESELEWECLNPELATIENGIIYAKAEGDVVVNLYYSNLTAQATFHIGHYVEFLDQHCYDFLIKAGYDTDGDERFSVEEMSAITEIYDTIIIEGNDAHRNIRYGQWAPYLAMMKNLEIFVSLGSPYNYIQAIPVDFSKNTKLKYLTLCYWRNVKIDNPHLESLFLYDYRDMDIDLGNSTNLVHITCHSADYSVPHTIDCSANLNLKYIASYIDHITIPKSVFEQTEKSSLNEYRLFRDFEEYKALLIASLNGDSWKEACTWLKYTPSEKQLPDNYITLPECFFLSSLMYIRVKDSGFTLQ